MPSFSAVNGIIFKAYTTAQRDAFTPQDRLVIFNSTLQELQVYSAALARWFNFGEWHALFISGDQHAEYARTEAPENITTAWLLQSGGKVTPIAGDPPKGEVVVQVKTSAGAPTHSAARGVICWVAPDDDTYMRNEAGWTLLAKQQSLDDHEAAADPHPTYETSAEAQAKIDTHAAAADPHTVYQKESEKGAASGYAGLTAGTKLNLAQMQEVMAHADLTDSPATAHVHSHKVSKSYIFEFPAVDLAVGDFIPENAIRVPASGKHGTIVLGIAYARDEVVGTGTNTILIRTSTTLTGARTTRGTINLGTAREAQSAAMAFTVSDGMYLWVECSAVGATAPQKTSVQVDTEETSYGQA